MSTFDHTGLIQDINECLAPFRKAQPDAMAGFGQLARAYASVAIKLIAECRRFGVNACVAG